MKRQRRHRGSHENIENDFYMQRIVQPQKFESTIEAQVQDGETLQALALRFHCTVAEIKRLNKIDKDNEIYARKIIKVPLTPHSILLETLPDIHKSGQNSPKHKDQPIITKDDLNNKNLNEKLLIASVNSSELSASSKHDTVQQNGDNINQIILNSRLKPNNYHHYSSNDGNTEGDDLINDSFNEPLLSGIVDESIPQPRPIPVPSKAIFDCSGSDCDMSWICLFICILAICFAIPLIYVFYIAEHPEKFHHNS